MMHNTYACHNQDNTITVARPRISKMTVHVAWLLGADRRWLRFLGQRTSFIQYQIDETDIDIQVYSS